MKLIKLKKILASLTATALALTTMVFAPATVSAEDTDLFFTDGNLAPAGEVMDAVKIKLNFTVTDLGGGYGTMTAYANSKAGWKQETFAPDPQYTGSIGQDWEVNNLLSATGSYSSTLDIDPTGWWYSAGLKTSDAALVAKVDTIEFLDSSSNVIKSVDVNAPSISTGNFTYSELENVNLGKGDTVTIAYDCDNVPDTAQYMIKYKVKTSPVTYYTAVDNGNILTDGEADTGMVVTKSTSGTVTTFTFTGTSSSIAEFGINVEVSANGTWSDTQYLWFGQETNYKVTAATYSVTIDPSITNGKVTADKTTDLSEGDKVTLTVTPDEGYILENIVAKTSDDVRCPITDEYTFTMPAADVTVTASFIEKPVESKEYTVPVNVADMTANKVYVQEAYTSSTAATKNVRFVAKISKETAQKNSSVTMKISNGTKEAEISSPITTVYTSVKSAGQIVFADPVKKNTDPDYVFVVYTVKDVPMGIDLNVSGGLTFTAVE